MARKKRKRAAGRRKSDRMPGWVSMMTGLVIGLTVALFVYISELKPPTQLKAIVQEQKEAATKAVDEAGQSIAEAVDDAVEIPEITFDFYEMLPNLDVEVYEDDPPSRVVTRSAPPARVSVPGIYILQAGSFYRIEDANRRKAELALLGVRSEIKRGIANQRTVYRVYTAPMERPDEVNRISEKLRDSNIEILLKRVSD